MDKDNRKIWLKKEGVGKADTQSEHAQPCWDPEGVLCLHTQLMASSLITNSHPPFLSVPNFSSFSIVCARPPFSLPPTAVPSNSCVVLQAPLICPWPALFASVPLFSRFPPSYFLSLRGRLGLGLGSGLLLSMANSSDQASAWKQELGEEDKRMAKTLMPDRVRQKSIVKCIQIFDVLLHFFCAVQEARQVPLLKR